LNRTISRLPDLALALAPSPDQTLAQAPIEQHSMAAPPPLRRPPALMDELMEEILLRLPPDKPVLLVRAALVCKRWCRLVADKWTLVAPTLWSLHCGLGGQDLVQEVHSRLRLLVGGR
jgi:hypothetical protein